MNDKKILVVPRADMFRWKYFNGFVDKTCHVSFANFQWKEREGIEEDYTLKQIIPYLVLQHNDTVFTYCRNTKCGESRLHNMRSIGIGGHIKEELDKDEYLHDIIQKALLREFLEEISVNLLGDIPFVNRAHHIGYINDDSNPVGRVHFGMVFRLYLDEYEAKSVELKEPELCNPQWINWDQLALDCDETRENWTRLLFPALLMKQEFVLEFA